MRSISLTILNSLLAILLVSSVTTRVSLAKLQDREIDFSKLRQVGLAELQQTKTPGAAVGIIKNDQVIFEEGLGTANIETGAPITTDALFHIGSVTKMFTAAALVILSDEGKFKLDDPIGIHVRGLPPKLAQITVHQLLSQTSGLKDVPGDSGSHEESALGDFARSLKDEDLVIENGRAFSYSNAGYSLAGYIIEQVSGKPYADQLNESLFKPLGMSRTTLRPTVAMTYPLVAGHTAQGQEQPKIVRPLADDTRLWPAGYIFTSLHDLTRFIRALLNGGKLAGRQALPAAVAVKLLSTYIDIPTNVFVNGNYGYGFFSHDYEGTRMFEHGGLLPGYSSEVRLLPAEHVAVIILSNRDAVRLNKTFLKAFELALPTLHSSSLSRATPPKPELAISEQEMARLAGKYVNRWPIEIFVRDGQLMLRQFGNDFAVTKIGENRFAITPPGATQSQEFVISNDPTGKPTCLQMALWVFKKN